MAEFIIKRIDATNPNETKDREGCYKRGDIIDIMDDGLAETMPHLTVIKVPGLKKKDALLWKERKIEPFTRTIEMTQNEFDKTIATPFTDSVVNGVTYSTIDGLYTKVPILKKELRLIEVKTKLGIFHEMLCEIETEELDTHTRRRFQISTEEMDELFPGRKTVVEMTISEWETLKTKITDKK